MRTAFFNQPGKGSLGLEKSFFDEKVDSLNMIEVIRDARPFLDNPAETRLFDKALLKGLVPNIVYDAGS